MIINCAKFIVFFFLLTSMICGADNVSNRHAKLVIKVTVGNSESAARDVFVYLREQLGQVSTPVRSTRSGYFEIPVSPGVYDLFISESTCLPVSKRLDVKAGETKQYEVSLQSDSEHMEN